MATRVDENSQPALRLVGRNSNPLVANVISPAFAKNIKEAARQSGARQFFGHPTCAGPGFEPGSPSFHRALLPCSPAGIPAASNLLKDQFCFQKRTDKLLPRRYSVM
jgi:hypothetical protein